MMDKCVKCRFYKQHYAFCGAFGFTKSKGSCFKFDNFEHKRKCDLFEADKFYDEEITKTLDVLTLFNAVRKRFILQKNSVDEFLEQLEEFKTQFLHNSNLPDNKCKTE